MARRELAGLVVGVWGVGKEGLSMARTASDAGAARIDAVDDAGRGRIAVPEEISAIARLTVYRGAEHLERFRDCDVVFVSPGVPWAHPLFTELRSTGRASSAADWYMARHANSTVGVTGTKGKSTTASFLGRLLATVGTNVEVAGNIGTPLSDLTPADDVVVIAEVSSQQAALLSVSPAIAVVTNLYEDHLDWHGDVAAYYRAKANVFRNGAHTLITTPAALAAFERVGVTEFPDVVLVDPDTVEQPNSPTVTPSSRERSSAMGYAHNVVNGALAIAAAERVIGRTVTAAEAEEARRTFEGLPARLQTVRTTGRIRWIDDTLATTGESVVAALSAMRPDDHVAVIVGGMDRQLNYDQVDDYLCGGARRVTLIQSPSNGADIGVRFAARNPDRVYRVDSLEAAVRAAAALPDVDVVLLSPGAASYDLFANYEAKGAAFRSLIDGLADSVGGAD